MSVNPITGEEGGTPYKSNPLRVYNARTNSMETIYETDDQLIEQARIARINHEADERFLMRLVGCIIIALLLLAAVMVYITRGGAT